MALPILTLKPNRSAELTIGRPDYWFGESGPGTTQVGFSTELVQGPDIRGAVRGLVTQELQEHSWPVIVDDETAEGFLASAHALDSAMTALGRNGGTIVYQVQFDDGTFSEALETEVLECAIVDYDPLWVDKRLGKQTLSFTTQPYWLADWEQVGSVAASTDSVILCEIDALRGNLPGPGRIVFEDNASTARRFVELGGAFEHHETSMDVEFRAGASGGDFSLTGADGSAVTTSVTDRIGTHTISVSPVLPAWTTVAFIEDLTRSGSYNVRARCLCEDEDVTVTVRALWRSGSGAWRELDSAEIPADGWWDLKLGVLSHYDEAETIDVRFDVRATEVTSSTFRLNTATVTPTDLYTVARGQTSEGVAQGATGYDDMTSDFTDMASRSAQLGGAWTAFGSGDQFIDVSDYGVQTRSDTDASLTAGRGYILDALSATVTQTVGVLGRARTGGNDSNAILGAVFRYSNPGTPQFGLLALRDRKKANGKHIGYVTLYKSIGGTLTKLKERALPTTAVGGVFVSVTAGGDYEVFYTNRALLEPGERLFGGTDSVFATSGTLEQGKMGFYGASDGSSNSLAVYGLVGYADATESVVGDVIRDDGTGEITYSSAFSADADGTDPHPVSSAEGRRIWLPPNLDGLISAKVRTSDSDAEVDTGHTNSTDLTVYHRPAFASLSDVVA